MALGEVGAAADLLQKIRVRSAEATEQIAIRLAVITGADDDDELNDDFLSSPDPFFLDMAEAQEEQDSPDNETPSTAAESVQSETAQLKQEAEALVSSGNIPAAIDVYTKVLELDSDDEAALIRFGELMAMDTEQDADFREDLQQQGFSDIDPMDFDPSRFQIGAQPEASGDSAHDTSSGSSDFESDSIDDIEDDPIVEDDIVEDLSVLRDSPALKQARGLLLVRQFDAAAAAAEQVSGLAAAVVYSDAMRQLGKLRQAKGKLQAEMDASDRHDPSYPEALWELVQIYIRAQKAAPAQKHLDELRDLAPGFRIRDCEALRIGLQQI